MTIASDELSFVDQGTGPSTIVLFHGWCCRTGDFAAQVNALSKEHRVVAIDWQDRMRLRGSDRSFDGICRDAIELLGQLDIDRPILCGHSMGGYFALQLVATHGFEARGVLCLDTTMPVTDSVRTAYGAWVDELTPENLVRFYHTACSLRFFKPAEIGGTSQSIMKGMMERPVDEARDLLREVCSPDFLQDYQAVSTPFHYVASGVNGISTESTIKDLIPHAGYERLEESGHFLTIFHPDRITRVISDLMCSV